MDTKQAVLDSAQRLVQQRGFNGFSYADIAEEIGIRKASLHHHFATKADLGLALIARYASEFDVVLDAISRRKDKADAKLRRYVDLYRTTLSDQRMCLCGMLGAEVSTLEPAFGPPLTRFFAQQTNWLAGILIQGRDEGTLRLAGSPKEIASTCLATLQGALMVARSTGDTDGFDRTSTMLLKMLNGKG